MRSRTLMPLVLGVVSVMACNEDDRKLEALPPPEWTHEFTDTCPDPYIKTSTWELVDGGRISFRIPPSYAPDTTSVNYDAEGTTFHFQERTIGYCWPCAPFTGNSARVRCRKTIGGRECFISVYGPGPDGRYFTGATWLAGRNPMIAYENVQAFLVIGGFSPDEEGQQEALAVIHTVRFNPP